MSLNGKVALVTGAGSGIGRGAAIALAAHGAEVAAADLNIEAANQVVESLREKSAEARAFQADVSQSAAVDAAVAQVMGHFRQIDILVHCAGIGPHGPILQMTD